MLQECGKRFVGICTLFLGNWITGLILEDETCRKLRNVQDLAETCDGFMKQCFLEGDGNY